MGKNEVLDVVREYKQQVLSGLNLYAFRPD